jgi:hypothetical protein
MFLGAFVPLVLVVCLGLLVAAFLVVREIRMLKGAFRGTASKAPPMSLGRESSAQESKTRYKPYEQGIREKQLQANKNEDNSADRNQWRW